MPQRDTSRPASENHKIRMGENQRPPNHQQKYKVASTVMSSKEYTNRSMPGHPDDIGSKELQVSTWSTWWLATAFSQGNSHLR
ncbi:uncharacterized protein DS421_5g160130 [Arachis hypogaea]|nr:uncharacterized protein DS421_5g160130 [Arachis hypogaea]